MKLTSAQVKEFWEKTKFSNTALSIITSVDGVTVQLKDIFEYIDDLERKIVTLAMVVAEKQ